MRCKIRISTLLWLLAGLLFLVSHCDAQIQGAAGKTRPPVHILLVGVSDYTHPDDPKSLPDLNCAGDVFALAKVFQTHFAVPAGQITSLKTKSETTHKAIVEAFRQHLIDQTKPGDIVFFHFSGHGSLAVNLQKQEQLEQTFVPSDYVARNDPSNDIRYSEIARLIQELKYKQPGSIVLSFDASHAGGSQTEEPKTVRTNNQKALGLGADGKHGFVVLAAGGKYQASYQVEDDNGHEMGLLSYALAKALSSASLQTTYRDLYDHILAIISWKHARFSEPEIQGDTDNVVLDKHVLPSEPYLLLQMSGEIQMEGKSGPLYLSAGYLQNMSLGSHFAIYPQGIKSFAKATPLALAEVTDIGATESTLKLLPPYAGKITSQQLLAARAVEIQHKYKTHIAVDLRAVAKQPAFQSLLVGIRKLPFVHEVSTATEKAETRLVTRGNLLRLERADGTLLAGTKAGKDAATILTAALQREIRWQFVRNLKSPNNDPIKIEMRLVPVTAEKDARVGQASGHVLPFAACGPRKRRPGFQLASPVLEPGRVKDEKGLDRGEDGVLELANGARVMIEIRCDEPAYVNIVNLGADGTLNPIWPHPSLALKDTSIAGGWQWQRLPFVLEITEPYGLESLKAIVTNKPTDFSYLMNMAPPLPATAASVSNNDSDIRRASAARCGALVFPLDWGACAVEYRIVPTTSRLHILAVGAGGKGNDAAGLGTTSDDAQAIADGLEMRGKSWYRKVFKQTLTGKDATRAAIQKAFEQVAAQAKPQDTFVFYYGGAIGLGPVTAGHIPELLLTPQSGAPGEEAAKAITSRLLRTWTGRVPAEKQVLLLDVCSPDRPFTAFMDQVKADDPDLKDLVPRQTMIMGSVGQRILFRGKHGPFTDALLHGLSGKAASADNSAHNQIMASDLEDYLKSKLLEVSEHKLRLGSQQIGDDFPVAPVAVAPRAKPTSGLRTVALVNAPEEDTTAYVRAGKDYALLIGTDHYDNENTLKNPLNDVRAVDVALRTLYGFQTEVLEDPSCKEILEALHRYFVRKDFAPDDQLLIYIAGHGNYGEKLGGKILCRDSKDDAFYDDTVITYRNLCPIVNAIPCRHILLVLDVCYGGSVFETTREGKLKGKAEPDITSSELLKTLMGKTTRLALTSGNKEPVRDGVGEHSPFASRFLEALETMQGKTGILRASTGLLQQVQTAKPQPVWGYWGDNQPGSDFVFIAGPK